MMCINSASVVHQAFTPCLFGQDPSDSGARLDPWLQVYARLDKIRAQGDHGKQTPPFHLSPCWAMQTNASQIAQVSFTACHGSSSGQ